MSIMLGGSTDCSILWFQFNESEESTNQVCEFFFGLVAEVDIMPRVEPSTQF